MSHVVDPMGLTVAGVTSVLPLYGGTGTWRSTSSSTLTLVATDGVVEFGASCTVTLPVASLCKVGQRIVLIASVAGITLTIVRAGSDTIDATTSLSVVLGTIRGGCTVVTQSSSAWGSLQSSSTGLDPGSLTIPMLTSNQTTQAFTNLNFDVPPSVLSPTWVP